MRIKIKVRYKVMIAFIIIAIITALTWYLGTAWIMMSYPIILALFPNEIRAGIMKLVSLVRPRKQIRVSFAYLFRIQYQNLYLLVKDEQGRNSFHPVGGVYKYDPNKIDIADKFEGEYDGLFSMGTDTESDLRLKIAKSKRETFENWFKSGKERENATDLSREFIEELLDTDVLPERTFKKISYKYIGSCSVESTNEELHMHQIRHFDIFNVKLTSEQRKYLDHLRTVSSANYVFASEEDIECGSVSFSGRKYMITDSAKYVLVRNARNLRKEFNFGTDEFTVSLKKSVQIKTKTEGQA